MQFQSTLPRLAAFILLVLSFSMLACAAPALVPAGDALVARGADVSSNSLVARTDVSDQCHQALVDLDAKLNVKIDLLSEYPSSLCSVCMHRMTVLRIDKCHDTQGCDCKPIVAKIVADIQVCVDIIAKLSGTIVVKLDLIVELVVSIILVSSILPFVLITSGP